ncbi:MAG: hypothetical protein FWG66_10020 [Spirochaetes bacterium]|nr:hypothetical protein [Spirochaetota bacterium]
MKKFRVAFALACLLPVLAGCQSQGEAAAGDQMAWRAAYAELLREAVPAFTDSGGRVFGYFLLHDIDGSGIPELVLFEADLWTGALSPVRAYAFSDGSLRPLELGDFSRMISSSIYAPADGTGIAAITGGGGDVFFFRLELEDGVFRTCATGELELFEYVFADDAGEASFRQVFVYTIDGREVGADEFWSVFTRWDEAQNLTRPITEGDIYSAIFGD